MPLRPSPVKASVTAAAATPMAAREEMGGRGWTQVRAGAAVRVRVADGGSAASPPQRRLLRMEAEEAYLRRVRRVRDILRAAG